MAATTAPPRRDRLRLVPRAMSGLPLSSVARISLAAAPFRPGELPTISWLVLDTNSRAFIAASASHARLPVELWVRIAVEASRLLEEVASRTNRTQDWVTATLDHAASRQAHANTRHLATASLDRYADNLEAAHPSGGLPHTLPLRLPEEMSGAWVRDAVRHRESLPSWISTRLQSVPTGCVRWEAASARACQSLGEWAYASSLLALTSSIA